MKALAPLALLALAALSPAPINDSARAPKPVPERSQTQLLKETSYSGAYRPVGNVPKKLQEGSPLRDAPSRTDSGAVATASAALASRDNGSIARASEHLTHEQGSAHTPAWLLALLAIGGAFGIVQGLKFWADRSLPVPGR